jgi:transcriptional regulator with XRE-family HTH domain
LYPILYKTIDLFRMGNTMPAKAPPVGDILAEKLRALGARIRTHRERQKVSASLAAEAAGMSRVTLHRIERGEPSVTMGAYLSAIAAIGLELDVIDPRDPHDPHDPHHPHHPRALRAALEPRATGLPARVRLADYPQLKHLAWQLQGVTELSPGDALSLYERNWRHIDQATLQPAERALVKALADQLGGGRLLA